MPGREQLVDFSELDLDHVVADIDEIRRYIPQRYEIEQLTAIIHEDKIANTCVGYKDVTDREFWCRGHMPGMPLMPGVLQCEAAAQLCSYFSGKYDLMDGKMLGFGGMEHVRFREPVRPGNRLVIMSGLVKVRRGAMIMARFQCYVAQSLVSEGEIKGIALPIGVLTGSSPAVGND